MKALCGLLLGVVVLVQTPAVQSAECVKTIRWFDDAPYSFRGTDGEIQGFNADLARAALQQLGCEARYVEMPWARALLELERGRLDILPGTLRKPEREGFAYFSRPYNRSPNVLFMGKAAADKYRIKQLSDLLGTDFRLGAQIGVSYGESYDALVKTPEFMARLSPITLRRSAWQMIDLNRIDGLIADEVTGLLELRQLGLSDAIAKTRVVVSGDPARFAFSKKTVNPDFVDRFNQALNAMLADGRYKQIGERYLPCQLDIEKLGCK